MENVKLLIRLEEIVRIRMRTNEDALDQNPNNMFVMGKVQAFGTVIDDILAIIETEGK